MAQNRNNSTIVLAILLLLAVAVSGLFGYYLSAIGNSVSSNSKSQANTVNMDLIPDYGGSGYDAFVLTSTLNSESVPAPASGNNPPGTNDNNVSVSSGTTVTFVITTIDTVVLQNFTGQVVTPFTVYNDTSNGVVASQYQKGQTEVMPMGHTFTISQLGINVPIPPDTVVKFDLTFSKPGVYLYNCMTPCGPGMGLNGYMNGYIIVK